MVFIVQTSIIVIPSAKLISFWQFQNNVVPLPCGLGLGCVFNFVALRPVESAIRIIMVIFVIHDVIKQRDEVLQS